MIYILSDNLSGSVEMLLHFRLYRSEIETLRCADPRIHKCRYDPHVYASAFAFQCSFLFIIYDSFTHVKKKSMGLHLHTYPHSNQPHKSCICTESPSQSIPYTQECVSARLDIHVCTIVMGFLVSWEGSVRGECLSMPLRME